MNASELLAMYARVADTPAAVQRLRQFVLDLAVRGRLVPQDQADGTATELLQVIVSGKPVAQGARTTRERSVNEAGSIETPFDLPASWRWTTLGTIASYIQRGKSPKYSDGDGAVVVSQRCVQWDRLDLSVAKRITLESLPNYEPERFLREGDILWNSTGTGTIGRLIRLRAIPSGLVCDSHVTVVRAERVNPDYLAIWLRSEHVYGKIEGSASGATNQVELTAKMAQGQPVPLPPLPEQHRIVAKVDELMALCDQLESARKEREAARDRLAAASLARLNSPDPDNFQADARFVLNVLPVLSARPDQVKQLREVILNLAMRGKLVPQHEFEAGALRSVRGQLATVKESGEVMDTLPHSWVQTTLGSVANLINGDRGKNYPNRNEYVENGVAFINTGHIRPGGRLSVETMHFLTREKFHSLRGGKIQRGDLVYCLRGATLGKTALVEPFAEGAIASSLVIIRPGPLLLARFAYQFLVSPLGRQQISRFDNGTAQPNLSANNVKLYTVPLPPVAEQQRIVERVNELMALCDRLEKSLEVGVSAHSCLLDALLREAIEQSVSAIA